MGWQQEYVEKYYGSRPGWIDGTSQFHEICASVIPKGAEILEIGAGPSNPTSRFLATLGNLHGVDIDPEIRTNDALVTTQVLASPADAFLLDSQSIDACVSNYVLEHVADPTTHLSEVNRVLRPGGAYLFRTPNIWHYASAVAYLTPQWCHEVVSRWLRQLAAERHDPYPTVFRMNSRRAVRVAAAKRGLLIERLDMVEKEPSYGNASRLLFFPFMAYERIVNSSELFAGLRALRRAAQAALRRRWA